ncbi:MAG: DNA alkylation repair protein [Flavobacteriales bacterium]
MTTPEILDTLRSLGTAERRAFMERVCPTGMEVYGVTLPDIKQILREMRALSKTWELDRLHGAALELMQTGVHEAHLLGLEWLTASKKHIAAYSAAQLWACNVHMDNWAAVDTYAVRLLGQGWRLGTVPTADIYGLLTHQDPMQRRLGVVCTVALNLKARGGTGDLPRTLAVCEQVVTDHHDMVVKALSWALREASKTDAEPVRDFLDAHRETLHKRVIREVEKKLDTGRKNG